MTKLAKTLIVPGPDQMDVVHDRLREDADFVRNHERCMGEYRKQATGAMAHGASYFLVIHCTTGSPELSAMLSFVAELKLAGWDAWYSSNTSTSYYIHWQRPKSGDVLSEQPEQLPQRRSTSPSPDAIMIAVAVVAALGILWRFL